MQMILLRIQEGLRAFLFKEEGQDLVEYALLVSLIALAAIAGTKDVGSIMATLYNNISTSLT